VATLGPLSSPCSICSNDRSRTLAGVVEVLLLGPVVASDDDGAYVDLGARGRRVVLVALAENVGRVVSVRALIERLWDGNVPATATNIVQGYVAKLRQVLGDAITTRSPGYVLDATTDVIRFDDLTRRAEGAPPSEARLLLQDALALWRGDYAADVGSPRAPHWEERRVAAIEAKVEAELAVAPSSALVAELAQLVSLHPWRERLWTQLAWGLDRLGRRAEGLRCLNAARAQLAEAGLEPGPAIAAMEQRLLLDSPVVETTDMATDITTEMAAAHDFIGRDTDLAAAFQVMGRSNTLSIVGPGGAGKTSLARELGRRTGGQVWFVDLAAVAEPSLVAAAAAAALGVDERAEADLGASLEEWSRGAAGIVIVDNCEHVLDEAAQLVERLTRAGSTVRVIATSREPLRVDGEFVQRLGPMEAGDAERLFRARLAAAGAEEVQEDDDVIARLCRRLDHLPLALELAAARAAALGAANVEQRLDDRLALLEADRAGRGGRGRARHSSLRSLLDWGVELLDPDEVSCLRRLSVFAGTFSLGAAERVTAASPSTVARLVDKSLLHREGAQFRLLETIHHHAAALLRASGEDTELQDAHLSWCAELEILDESVDAEVRAALDRARRAQPSAMAADFARRAASAALARRLLTEALSRAEVAVEISPDDISRGHSEVLLGEMWSTRWRGDEAIAAYRQAITSFLSAGREDLAASPRALVAEVMLRFPATVTNPIPPEQLVELLDAGLAVGDGLDPAVASQLWSARACLANERQGWEDAERASRRAVELATIADDAMVLSGALDALEAVQLAADRYGDAAATAQQRVNLLPRLTTTARGTLEQADIWAMRADTALRVGDFAASVDAAERGASFELDRGLPASGLARLVRARFFAGQWDQAMADADAMLAGWERDGRPTATYLVLGIGARAAILGLRGDRDGMEADLGLARRVLGWRAIHNTWLAIAEATVLQAAGEPAAAKTALDSVQRMRAGWTSTHAAMSVEARAALGDDIDEALTAAETFVDADLYSKAILLRVRGELDAAAALFASLPCPWQADATLAVTGRDCRHGGIREGDEGGLETG